MREMIYFLTAGAFVYFGLAIQVTCGDKPYFALVALMLLGGYALKNWIG